MFLNSNNSCVVALFLSIQQYIDDCNNISTTLVEFT